MKGLKRPQLKPPAFVGDVYWDLRDRRLLPLIGLVLVAIVAVPFLLGDREETTIPPLETGAALEASNASELTVVEAQPGLRDYRKRLDGRTPTDPFRQQKTAPQLKGAKLNEPNGGEGSGGKSGSGGEGSGSGGGGKSSGGSSKGGGSGNGGGSGGSGSGGGSPANPTLYTFAVNLTITQSSGSEAEGDKKTSEPDKRKRVLPTTVLPGKKVQVVTYLGLSPKNRKPLFLISDKVTGVFGDGKCISGSDSCQLIELEPGFPELFEYGEGGDRYSIKVTKVELVLKGRV